jgi:hypothetical protein
MATKRKKYSNPVSRSYTTTKGERITVLKNGTKLVNGVEEGKIATPKGTRMVMRKSGSSGLVKIGSNADSKYDNDGHYKKAPYASAFKNTIQTSTSQRNRDAGTQNRYNEIMTSRGTPPTMTTPAPTVTGAPADATTVVSTRTGTGGAVPTDIATPTPTNTVTNPDGSKTVTMSDGTVKQEDAITAAENEYSAGVRKQLADLDTQRASFDKKIDRLLASNNSLYQSTVNSIKGTFDVRADAMRDNYSRLTASREKAGYQTNAFRYTPSQAEGLITETENAMVSDLADLDAQEQSLILAATTAKEQKDWDALEMQMEMYDTISSQKSTLMGNLLTTAQEQNRRIEAENKINREIAEKAAAVPTSAGAIALAKSVAPVLTKEIAKMNDVEKKEYIAKKAKELNIEPSILESQLIDRQREDDEYAKSLLPKPVSAPKLTEGEKKNSIFSDINDAMAGGYSVPNKNNQSIPYTNPSGFFTPEGFKDAQKRSRGFGISRKEFLEEYAGSLDPAQLEAYGLTAAERKLITGEDY